jgi:hypothetical protein
VYNPPAYQTPVQTGPISQTPLPKDANYFKAVMAAKKELSNAKKELNFAAVDKAFIALLAAASAL